MTPDEAVWLQGMVNMLNLTDEDFENSEDPSREDFQRRAKVVFFDVIETVGADEGEWEAKLRW
jgi:hypothetical protein